MAVRIGTPGSDSIAQVGSNDITAGLSGNDAIRTFDGVDIAFGGAGIDTLTCGNATSILVGGADGDVLAAEQDAPGTAAVVQSRYRARSVPRACAA